MYFCLLNANHLTIMDTKKHQHEDPEAVIEGAIGRTELFIAKNAKKLLIALAVVIVVVGGYFGYKYLYVAPQAQRAATAIYVAEQLFAEGNYDAALNGEDGASGFLAVISKYGNTLEGNIAYHYVGQCYMKLGQFEEALKSFDKYDNVDGVPAEMINAMNEGLKGDCYVQIGNMERGAECYEEAIGISSNEMTAPIYLKKLALVLENLGKIDDAMEACQRIKTQYSGSLQARDIDKYMGRLMDLQ